jgi:hypothetical protein
MRWGRRGEIRRDWWYWYDANGVRYLPPEGLLEQEGVEREQLMWREVEERLLLAEEALGAERRLLALKMVREGIAVVVRVTGGRSRILGGCRGWRCDRPYVLGKM